VVFVEEVFLAARAETGSLLDMFSHESFRTNVTEGLLVAVSLAVAAIPEGLTAITTVVLSLGTERMARRRVIIRKLSAVQALGSATVICSDKTGTLTKNEMTVRVAITAGGRSDLTGTGYEPTGELLRQGRPLEDPGERADALRLLRAAALASNATLHQQQGRWGVLGDPTEGALVVAARKAGVAAEALSARFNRVGEIPFSSERKLMSTAQTDTDRGGRTVLVSKGAPDILLARCTHERAGEEDRPLTAERRRAILAVAGVTGGNHAIVRERGGTEGQAHGSVLLAGVGRSVP